MWDLETGREEVGEPKVHAAEVTKVVFLPDGLRALSASIDGTATLWDLETSRVLRQFSAAARSGFLALPLHAMAVLLPPAAQDGTVSQLGMSRPHVRSAA